MQSNFNESALVARLCCEWQVIIYWCFTPHPLFIQSVRRLRQRKIFVARHTPFTICLIVCAINCSEIVQCATHYSYYLCSTCPVPSFHHFAILPSSHQSDAFAAAHSLRAKLLRSACALHPNDLMRTEMENRGRQSDGRPDSSQVN